MKRSTPLRRKKAMKRKPPRRIKQRVADRPYLAFIASRPCAVSSIYGDCPGPIQVAHFRCRTGVGQKPSDRDTIPLCVRHHSQLDQYRGFFARWTREQRRDWAFGRIKRYNDLFDEYVAQGGNCARWRAA